MAQSGHRAHDGRMHFVTQAKKWKVDEYAIKYIVGHEINDVAERVYTKRDIEWMHEEVEKVNCTVHETQKDPSANIKPIKA